MTYPEAQGTGERHAGERPHDHLQHAIDDGRRTHARDAGRHGAPQPWSVATTRALADLDQGSVAELLAAGDAAFFTKPEPVLDLARHGYSFRVAIARAGHSRELVIGRPNAAPELERIARLARACPSDRKAIALATMSDEDRADILAALCYADAPERD